MHNIYFPTLGIAAAIALFYHPPASGRLLLSSAPPLPAVSLPPLQIIHAHLIA